MFKKPLSSFKPSGGPLRSSDRRKLRDRVLQSFCLPLQGDREAENVGDVLVPEGTRAVKFHTHLDEPGVAYLAPEGNPLWFTIGKGSDDLIPTVYTLWKRPSLLPAISTPASVIPFLVGGADLMIPGVVHCPTSLVKNELVCITQLQSVSDRVGSAVAVGRMALDATKLTEQGGKGKAVFVLHTWKDHLWGMGDESDTPSASVSGDEICTREGADAQPNSPAFDESRYLDPEVATPPPPSPSPGPEEPENVLSPQEVSDILRTSLLQAIQKTLGPLPASVFPMPTTTFYTMHLLPSRPASVMSQTPIDIKHSAHKSLKVFLKAAEKDHLLSLKSIKDELFVTAVFPKHAEVVGHRAYLSLRDVQAKVDRKETRAEAEAKKVKGMNVVEKWKPHQASIKIFQEIGKDTKALYTAPEVRAIINAYVSEKNLANAREQQYVNLDAILVSVLSTGSKSGEAQPLEFLKREELMKRLLDKMQPWYEIEAEGKETVLKKGQLKPISIQNKVWVGRKTTLVSNFEPFFLTADFLAEELRKSCASATSTSPATGKGSNAGDEVLVQGNHTKAVVDLLLARGVPKKWVETVDLGRKQHYGH